jgi:cellulase/cellobiase CelA1
MRLKAMFITLVIATAAIVVGAQQKTAPKLALDSYEHSFGTIKAGTPLKHTFKVKNVGNADLEISNVSPSCGCTTTNYDKKIAPGQTGNITLEIDKTDSYSGEVVKTADVTTNDPGKSSFTLTLKAKITAK